MLHFQRRVGKPWTHLVPQTYQNLSWIQSNYWWDRPEDCWKRSSTLRSTGGIETWDGQDQHSCVGNPHMEEYLFKKRGVHLTLEPSVQRFCVARRSSCNVGFEARRFTFGRARRLWERETAHLKGARETWHAPRLRTEEGIKNETGPDPSAHLGEASEKKDETGIHPGNIDAHGGHFGKCILS